MGDEKAKTREQTINDKFLRSFRCSYWVDARLTV